MLEEANVRLPQLSASQTTPIMPVVNARTFMRTIASGRINKMQERRIASFFSPGTKFAAEVGGVESFLSHCLGMLTRPWCLVIALHDMHQEVRAAFQSGLAYWSSHLISIDDATDTSSSALGLVEHGKIMTSQTRGEITLVLGLIKHSNVRRPCRATQGQGPLIIIKLEIALALPNSRALSSKFYQEGRLPQLDPIRSWSGTSCKLLELLCVVETPES